MYNPSSPSLSSSSRPPSATNSDDSIIDELSFDYTIDADGNPVRLNKPSASKSNHSTPPTPQDQIDTSKNSLPPLPSKKPPSPVLTHAPRSSLTRSESAYSVLTSPPDWSSANPTARSFKRVASGPIASTQPSLVYVNNNNNPPPSTSAVKARRVTMEEHKEQDARSRRQMEELRLRLEAEEETRAQAEKENLIHGSRQPSALDDRLWGTNKRHSPPLSSRPVPTSQRVPSALSARAVAHVSSSALSRPLADVPVPPQRVSRATRLAKYGSMQSTGFDRIPESDGVDEYQTGGEDTDTGDDLSPSIPTNSTARQRSYGGFSSSLTQSGNTRTRRSASMSEASPQETRLSPPQSGAVPVPLQYSARPASSLGVNARRVTFEDKERQDMEYRRYQKADPELNRDSHYYVKEVQHDSRVPGRTKVQVETPAYPTIQEHPPPNETRRSPSPTQPKPSYSHQRRDSDTMRSSAQPSSTSPKTAEAIPARLSPSARSYLSSVSSSISAAAAARHRRSPTAPDPPTTSGMLGPHAQAVRTMWAADEFGVEEHGFANGVIERARSVPAPDPPPIQKGQPTAAISAPNTRNMTSTPAAVLISTADARNRQIIVNKKAYARLDLIGKGGSSRVYRVMNNANELYAIKRVSLDKTDPDTMTGYMNEIALLKRLDGNSRIIRLIDSEVKAGPGGTKGHLMLVMECGEIDFSRLMQEQQKEPMDMVWVAYYWQQMLQAVHVIHEEKIVHSDLKPANFVLVRGQLKLIDFGIANAIANDTTNIQRDHQIGTVNYMSPEAIELGDGMRRLKVGRPSDVWSLGCILYQMIYGQPPFQHMSMFAKMKAIPNLAHEIPYPEYATPTIPGQRGGGGSPQAPAQKLDHLKRKVRRDVIESIKSCLCRHPKERAIIPDLLNHDWLAMKEPEVPKKPPTPPPPPPPPPPPVIEVKNYLEEDETIINPFYMKQLLVYGIKLGQAYGGQITEEQLLEESRRLIRELRRI